MSLTTNILPMQSRFWLASYLVACVCFLGEGRAERIVLCN